jgi:hypothetical protein
MTHRSYFTPTLTRARSAAGGREAVRAVLRQNASSGLENVRDEACGACLTRLFSRGNQGLFGDSSPLPSECE